MEEHDLVNQKVTIEALEDLDFDVIEDMPWAQQLWKDLTDHTRKGFLYWCRIVKSLAGTKDDHIKDWSKSYIETVDEILCDMVIEVLIRQNTTMDKIEKLLKRLQRVCLELNQPVPKKIGENKLGFYQEQEQLLKQIQEYEVIINSKKQDLEDLNKKQLLLCKNLGQEPKMKVQYPPLPTPEQMEELRIHIDEMDAEIFEREEQYCLLKHEITEYVKELNYKPNCDFERKVLSSDQFLVTDDNMEQLKFFAECLKDIKKSTEEKISQFRGRIEELWKMLDVDLRVRDEFRTHYTGNSLDTMEALRNELRRCEELRKSNIKIFVDKQRYELEDLWKQCHCSDREKTHFKYFYSDCYTEDLLDIHELEIQKWNSYYQKNRKLLTLLEKHRELWKKAIELEDKATDPNRYKNRGGGLLQEEKARNLLSKQIPKIENEIIALADEYRQINNVEFLSFGRTPQDYLADLHADRENERKLKLSARKIQRDNTTARFRAKSPLTLFPSTSTAVTPTILSATKRKVLATPRTENPKRLRMNTPQNANIQPKTIRTVPKIKVTYSTRTLPSQKRKSRSSLDKSKRTASKRRSRGHEGMRPLPVTPESNETAKTYTDFQTELSSREQCRSTLLPENVQQTPVRSSARKRALSKAP